MNKLVMFYQGKYVKSLQVISFRTKKVRWTIFTRYNGNWKWKEIDQLEPDSVRCHGSWLFRLYPLKDAVDIYGSYGN